MRLPWLFFFPILFPRSVSWNLTYKLGEKSTAFLTLGALLHSDTQLQGRWVSFCHLRLNEKWPPCPATKVFLTWVAWWCLQRSAGNISQDSCDISLETTAAWGRWPPLPQIIGHSIAGTLVTCSIFIFNLCGGHFCQTPWLYKDTTARIPQTTWSPKAEETGNTWSEEESCLHKGLWSNHKAHTHAHPLPDLIVTKTIQSFVKMCWVDCKRPPHKAIPVPQLSYRFPFQHPINYSDKLPFFSAIFTLLEGRGRTTTIAPSLSYENGCEAGCNNSERGLSCWCGGKLCIPAKRRPCSLMDSAVKLEEVLSPKAVPKMYCLNSFFLALKFYIPTLTW